jgi:hypothetical protein
MADIQLRDVIDNLRSRLQAELDGELASIAQSHDEALDGARRAAAADAERQWAARLDAVHADWSARLENEIAAARTEAEQQAVAEGLRARVDAEQAAAEATAGIRRELDQALAEEKARAEEEIRAERARADRAERNQDELRIERERAERALAETRAELETERQRAERALADARAELDAERQRAREVVASVPATAASVETSRLIAAFRDIDEAASLTDILRATVGAASAEAPRAALLLVNGAQLDEWTDAGTPSLGAGVMRVDGREAGFLSEALKRRAPVMAGQGLVAPAFAALGTDRRAMGLPLLLAGEPVALLYADDGSAGPADGRWLEPVQILARYAAAALAVMTARRTLQALGAPAAPGAAPASTSEDAEGARRYARLLVSEIKLYNEAAVRTGREMRDLSARLRPEIERARRFYEERVPAAVAARDMFFHQELVQTLAGGDPSLLG